MLTTNSSNVNSQYNRVWAMIVPYWAELCELDLSTVGLSVRCLSSQPACWLAEDNGRVMFAVPMGSAIAESIGEVRL
jgi:hypothetical protein